MKIIEINNTNNKSVEYFISGPYLKRKESGDDELYKRIKASWKTPLQIAFGSAAAFGAYLPHFGFAVILKFSGIDINPLQSGAQTLFNSFSHFSTSDFAKVGAIASVTFGLAASVGAVKGMSNIIEEHALEKANFQYKGINLDIATDEQIADFIGNNDSALIEFLKGLERDGYDIKHQNPLYETTRRPKSKAPKYDMSGGGGGGGFDGGGD